MMGVLGGSLVETHVLLWYILTIVNCERFTEARD
jgi:hypothetical protein